MQPTSSKANTSKVLIKPPGLFYKKDLKILFITITVFTFKPAYNNKILIVSFSGPAW